MEWSLKKIILIVVAVLLLLGTNASQYFLWWTPKQDEMKANYELELADKQAQLDEIGDMVGIWTIKDGVEDIFPGKQVDINDLTMREIPESLINQSFVLNPVSVVGKYYRIGLKPGTPISNDLVMEEPLDDTTREYDVVSNIMPIGLKVGDYVDYRIVYPLGEDYIVLTHKRIEAINGKTFKLRLNETEIHIYQAAVIDYFLHSKLGSYLYMTKYVEPGIQKAAKDYYAIPANIRAIMLIDPNIAEQLDAKRNKDLRTIIDAGGSRVTKELGEAILTGRNEISGKLDGGNTALENEEKERLDKEKQAAENGGASAEPEPTSSLYTPPPSKPEASTGGAAGDTGGTSGTGGTGGTGGTSGASGSSTAPQGTAGTTTAPEGGLNIGKGVVE